MQPRTLSRRRFLKDTGTAFALPTIVPACALGRSAYAAAPSERIVMGCIGVGSQGTYNLRAFLGQPDVEIVALCDVERGADWGWGQFGREPAAAIVRQYYQERKPGESVSPPDLYGDFREYLARDDLDATTVVTPDHWHAIITSAALASGRDVYCEKPLANSIVEGRAVCDAVQRYGRVLQVGSHERSRRNARFACELVRSGHIGELRTIRVNMPIDNEQTIGIQPVMPVPQSLDYDMWLGPALWAPYTRMRTHFWFRYILDYSGGEMTDRGAHIIDLGQLGNGSDDTGPVEIEGKGTRARDGLYNTFTEYKFRCRYANGVELVGENVAPRGIRFEGTEGWIFIHIHGGDLEAKPASLLNVTLRPGDVHLGRSPGHRRDFLDCVRSRRLPMAPPEAGQRTASICHLVNIAMLTGKKLEWDPKAERITNHPELNTRLLKSMRAPWCI